MVQCMMHVATLIRLDMIRSDYFLIILEFGKNAK